MLGIMEPNKINRCALYGDFEVEELKSLFLFKVLPHLKRRMSKEKKETRIRNFIENKLENKKWIISRRRMAKQIKNVNN